MTSVSSVAAVVELTRSRPDVARFLRVPFDLYRGDRCWVPPVLADQQLVFSDANPFFRHATMKLWVAQQNGRDVGRIAAIVDRAHNDFHHDAVGFFGFFECVNDSAVAEALFDAAGAWLKLQGMTAVRGPVNPSMNDECGLLIDGFDSRPVFMMTYNPRYYIDLCERAGFAKAKDLVAFYFGVSPEPFDRLERISRAVFRRNPGLTIRNIRKKTLAEDLKKVKEIYNDAWENNWGFVPMLEEEIDYTASRLKPLINEKLLFLAEMNGEPIGFQLNLPDYNEAFAKLRGRLLSPRMVLAVPYFLGWKTPKFVRVFAMGMKKHYRNRGLDAAMLAGSLKAGMEVGHTDCEVSWMLEDNFMVQRSAEIFGGRHYKTYRIYEKPL